VKGDVHRDTKSQHTRNDTEAHEVLWLVVGREEVSAVDLREIAHGIDKRDRDGPNFRLHGSESCASER